MFWVKGWLLVVLLGGGSGYAENAFGKQKKSLIKYRIVSDLSKAYDKITKAQHISILVTPPTQLGQDIRVEIYNNTKKEIAQVSFYLYFVNNSHYDYDSKIELGRPLLPFRSATRTIASKGKGKFPFIKKIRIKKLEIYNTDAVEVIAPVWVTLVRAPAAKPRKVRPKK